MSQNVCYLIFLFVSLHQNNNQMEENNNIEPIINSNDEYIKSVEEINKKILDELLNNTGVPKEYSRGFDYSWMNKQSWWNDVSSKRYTERLEEIAKLFSEESKKISLKMAEPFLINKDLCYAMKKFGSIRKFKKAAKKQHPLFGYTIYNPIQYIPMFKALSKAKNDKERRKAKSGIKKLFKYDFFDETEFATVKDKDKDFILDFADNMCALWNYNSIGFDFETDRLRYPMNIEINH